MNKIPKSFKLFASTINVEFDNKLCNDKEAYGLADYGACKIFLTKVNGVDKLSDDRIMDVFYHEKVHLILDSMGHFDLSKDEKFVDLFGKLLRQSDLTSIF